MDHTFEDLLRQAIAAFNKLTPEQKEAHLRASAISFVKGNLALSGIEADEELIGRLYDERKAKAQKQG